MIDSEDRAILAADVGDNFATLSTLDLSRMTDRAYREAARCYQEARAADPAIRAMLTDGAEDAQTYWRTLRARLTLRERADIIRAYPDGGAA